ncbi:MAG: hypothetical protein LAT84_11255 [Balneolia bacterium]|nr:hypothetical protein [Balneolia bacterium]
MKRFIIGITTILVLFVMAADINAQNRDRASGMQGNAQGQGLGLMHDLAIIYSGDLNLSEAQKQEIARIRAENRVEARQARSEVQRQRGQAQRGERPQAFRQQRMENRISMYDQINEVLTLEQREQLASIREERMANREDMQQHMSAAYVEIVSEDVGLDEEKTQRLTEIVREHRAEMSEVRSERRATTPQERADMTAVREAHQMQLMGKVREVLTEEEFELWSAQWQELMPGQQRQFEQRRDVRGRQDGNRMNRNRQN